MIISIVGQKGGVGKSTIAVLIGAELHRRGVNVLMVDSDVQGTVTTWSEAAANANQSIPTVVAMGENMAKDILKMAPSYDVVIVDTPGTLDDKNRKFQIALQLSDLAIVPVGMGAPEVFASSSTIQEVEIAQVRNPDLDARLLLNRIDKRTDIGKKGRAVYEQQFDIKLFDSQIPRAVSIEEFMMTGTGLVQYIGKRKAESKAIMGLIDEMMAMYSSESKEKGAA